MDAPTFLYAGKKKNEKNFVAVDNGFVGTADEWLQSLVGADGENGADGTDGADGVYPDCDDNVTEEKAIGLRFEQTAPEVEEPVVEPVEEEEVI